MQPSETDVKVLSLNGGGARGLFTISVLAEIERILEEKGQENAKIGDYFDLITGTSIGGVLALGLGGWAKALESLKNVFRINAPIIFPHVPSWKKIFQTTHQRCIR